MPPQRTERTHEENQERAYIAASRRSDRPLEARIESARRASDIHKRRTGKSLRVREEDVINEEVYEEEDMRHRHNWAIPSAHRYFNAHLQTGREDFDARLAAYLSNQLAVRNALDDALAAAANGSPPPPGTTPSHGVQAFQGRPKDHGNESGQQAAYAFYKGHRTVSPEIDASANTSGRDSVGIAPLSTTIPDNIAQLLMPPMSRETSRRGWKSPFDGKSLFDDSCLHMFGQSPLPPTELTQYEQAPPTPGGKEDRDMLPWDSWIQDAAPEVGEWEYSFEGIHQKR